MKTARVVLGYRGLNPSELITYSSGIYTTLNGNTNFPSAAPFVALLLTVNTALISAVAAAKPGDKTSTSAMHDAENKTKRHLRVLGALVDFEADGDETKVLSSGFDLKTFTPPTPKSFTIKLGKLSGSVDMEINSYGSAAYKWLTSPDPIGVWTEVALTTVSKVSIGSLTPGLGLWGKVVVSKGTKIIATSDPYYIMAV